MMSCKEEDAAPGLRHTKVTRIYKLDGDTVFTTKRKIFGNFFLSPHLDQARNIFQDKSLGAGRFDDVKKLSVERIPRVVEQPVVVPHLGEGLAGRTSDYYIGSAGNFCYGSPDRLVANIATDDLGSGEISLVRGTGVWVVVDSRKHLPACGPEALRETTTAAEEVDYFHRLLIDASGRLLAGTSRA